MTTCSEWRGVCFSFIKLCFLCRHPAAGGPPEEPEAEGAGGAGPRDRPAAADDRRLPELHRSAGQQRLYRRTSRGPAPDAGGGGEVRTCAPIGTRRL